MTRLVFVGDGPALVKVLKRLPAMSDLIVAGVFTADPPGMEIAAQARALGVAPQPAAALAGNGSIVESLEPDWLFNLFSTVILPAPVLAAARKGALNAHPGRLPEYAGLHTHQWAIRNGEDVCGVTLHWMEPRLDTGPIALTRDVPITTRDTGLSLFVKCAATAADLALDALQLIRNGTPLPRIPQDLSRRHLYRHADALEGALDFRWPARRIVDYVRAADYAPMKCPTYAPIVDFQGNPFIIRKARVGPGIPGRPGRVVAVGPDGISVAAGDGRTVDILAAEVPGHGVLRTDRLVEATGARPGQAFALPGEQATP